MRVGVPVDHAADNGCTRTEARRPVLCVVKTQRGI